MTSQENQNLLAEDVPAPTQPHRCFIVPLTLLQEILNNGNISEGTRSAVQNTYNHCCSLHEKRNAKHAELSASAAHSLASGGLAGANAAIHREIYDSKRSNRLRDTLVVKDGGNPKSTSVDVSAKEVFDSFGKAYQFYQEVFKRNSVDNENMKLIGSVHYDDKPGPPGMDNAFWDGDEMAFGDGDGEVFGSFTKDIDVIGHELTHGVVSFTANLAYEYQSGALDESMADVFGSMIKQYFHPDGQQTADDADWLVGEQIFLPSIDALALRSLKAPGTAYDNAILGKDPQTADMDGYVDSPNNKRGDWGGVHTNSGIPNHAFFLAAIALGGHSWDRAGKIWYAALLDEKLRGINSRKAFKIFAELTVKHALKFGAEAEAAVKKAWTTVKVLTTGGQHRDEL